MDSDIVTRLNQTGYDLLATLLTLRLTLLLLALTLLSLLLLTLTLLLLALALLLLALTLLLHRVCHFYILRCEIFIIWPNPKELPNPGPGF
jgi:hypothetical protein